MGYGYSSAHCRCARPSHIADREISGFPWRTQQSVVWLAEHCIELFISGRSYCAYLVGRPLYASATRTEAYHRQRKEPNGFQSLINGRQSTGTSCGLSPRIYNLLPGTPIPIILSLALKTDRP